MAKRSDIIDLTRKGVVFPTKATFHCAAQQEEFHTPPVQQKPVKDWKHEGCDFIKDT